jgi:hypothetical protein
VFTGHDRAGIAHTTITASLQHISVPGIIQHKPIGSRPVAGLVTNQMLCFA